MIGIYAVLLDEYIDSIQPRNVAARRIRRIHEKVRRR